MSAATSCAHGGASILEVPHGIHPDIPESIYHARVLGLASKSTLDDVRRSPAHYFASVMGSAETQSSDAFAFGTAFHCATLEPERFDLEYAAEPDFGDCRRTENKARRDEWRKANGTKTHLSSTDMAKVVGMSASVRAHPIAHRLLVLEGNPEVTLRWRDSDTGIECKARVDRYLRGFRAAVDLKTTEDARLDVFRRTMARFGYHRQEAMYRDGFAALGEPIEHFIFVAVEKTSPYAVAVYSIDAGARAKGRASIHQDLRTLARCVEQDTWPGYDTGIQSLSLPEWSE